MGIKGFRYVAAFVLVAVALLCLNDCLGYIWAASFRDANYEKYIRRACADLFVFLAAFIGTAVSLLWGKLTRRFGRHRESLRA